MTGSVQNSVVNNNLKSQGLHIGVVCPPEKFTPVVLYSDADATQQFKQLNRDVCTLQNKVNFEQTKKTPKSVWVVLGAGILTVAGFAAKKLLKK